MHAAPKQIVRFFFQRCVRTLILVSAGLLFALTLSSLIDIEIVDHLKRQISKPLLILYAELIGFISPGPRYILYPVLVKLKEFGMDTSILIALISGHVLIEPSTAFMEYGFFGITFPVKRFIVSLVSTYVACLLTLLLMG